MTMLTKYIVNSRKEGLKHVTSGYKCPFCIDKKRKIYNFEGLFQHATGIDASSNRNAKDKATHRALTKYLKTDIPGSSLSDQAPTLRDNGERFVWPWKGVLVNVPTEFKDGKGTGESDRLLKKQFSRFNVLRVHSIWNSEGHTGICIVEFSNDWKGFKDALSYENHFVSERCSKRDWHERRSRISDFYGWVAREDYNGIGPIAKYLRKNSVLKTVNDLAVEDSCKANTVLANLADQVDAKNRCLHELECKYKETTLSY